VKVNDHNHQTPDATQVVVGMVDNTYRVIDHIHSADRLREPDIPAGTAIRTTSYMPTR